jgi:germination protein M
VTRLLLTLVVLALVAGCGGGDTEAEPTDPDTGKGTAVSVYWLREGKVWPALRIVAPAESVASAAVLALFQGPTEQEGTELGLTTGIPDAGEAPDVSVEDGVALVQYDVQIVDEALAQVVYTLTQFPTVERVEIQERIVTRADFEDETPAILVESPLSFEEVSSPLRVTGTANTFEANFQYELTDTDGRIVDQNFVTATSGTGTRGTFDFTTDAFTVPFDGVGELIVFESSAKDGSRINLVEIPLRMKR